MWCRVYLYERWVDGGYNPTMGTVVLREPITYLVKGAGYCRALNPTGDPHLLYVTTFPVHSPLPSSEHIPFSPPLLEHRGRGLISLMSALSAEQSQTCGCGKKNDLTLYGYS